MYDLRNTTNPALIYNPFSQEEDSDDDEEEEEDNDDYTGTCCKFNHNGLFCFFLFFVFLTFLVERPFELS